MFTSLLPVFRDRHRSGVAASVHRRHRSVARPWLEALEARVTPSTYIWTAQGDGQTWNDASNWYLAGSSPLIKQPTVPTPYSNVIFPPIATLPGAASKTINFNFTYLNMPLDSLTVEDSYTFTGNPSRSTISLSVSNPFTTAPGGATATFLLAGLQLEPGVVINTGSGSTLQLASASDPTGLAAHGARAADQDGRRPARDRYAERALSQFGRASADSSHGRRRLDHPGSQPEPGRPDVPDQFHARAWWSRTMWRQGAGALWHGTRRARRHDRGQRSDQPDRRSPHGDRPTSSADSSTAPASSS